jgi:hypothetical protein
MKYCDMNRFLAKPDRCQPPKLASRDDTDHLVSSTQVNKGTLMS